MNFIRDLYLFRAYSNDHDDWQLIRSLLFKKGKTAEEILESLSAGDGNAIAYLVGDCQSLITWNDRRKPKRLALVIPREEPLPENFASLFRKALRSHRSQKQAKEIFFKSLNLVLNVHVLQEEECVSVDRLEELFTTEQGRPCTEVVQCRLGSKVKHLDYKFIGGLCPHEPESRDDLKNVASLKLTLANGDAFWDDGMFAPGCPEILCRFKEVESPIGKRPTGPIGFKLR